MRTKWGAALKKGKQIKIKEVLFVASYFLFVDTFLKISFDSTSTQKLSRLF